MFTRKILSALIVVFFMILGLSLSSCVSDEDYGDDLTGMWQLEKVSVCAEMSGDEGGMWTDCPGGQYMEFVVGTWDLGSADGVSIKASSFFRIDDGEMQILAKYTASSTDSCIYDEMGLSYCDGQMVTCDDFTMDYDIFEDSNAIEMYVMGDSYNFDYWWDSDNTIVFAWTLDPSQRMFLTRVPAAGFDDDRIEWDCNYPIMEFGGK